MLNKGEKIEIVKVGIILFLITAISAGLLAIVNAKTSPIIAQNESAKQQMAMSVVLPGAKSFGTENLKTDDMDKTITAVYKADGDEGYVVMALPKGYGGEISLVVGVTNEGTVSGVNVVSQSETAGLGAKCTNSDFTNQFEGKTENIGVSKTGGTGNTITAISSATITSKAVTSGVNAAIQAAKMAKEAE